MFSEDGRLGLMTDRAGTMIGVATMRQGQARRATPKCFDCFEWRCRLSITRRRLDVDDHFGSIVFESICLHTVEIVAIALQSFRPIVGVASSRQKEILPSTIYHF